MPARACLVLVLGAALAGCSGGDADPGPRPTAPAATSTPTVSAAVTLPPDPLRAFVPDADDVPPGLLPVVSGSGPRDLAQVAAFSGDPGAAATALRAHGFEDAYVAQYAEPRADGRVLSVVVAQFATLKGAADDLAGDVAASSAGEPADVGQGGRLAVQPLPGARGQLTTLRFRVGVRTFLLAYGAPDADRETVLALGRAVAGRAAPT